MAEKEVLTSPRLLPAPPPDLPEGQRWGSEIAALHRSVESLQAMMGMVVAPAATPEPFLVDRLQEIRIRSTSSASRPASPTTVEDVTTENVGGSPPPAAAAIEFMMDGARTAVRGYAERHIEHLQRRMLLWDAWQLWSTLVRTADLRARLELAVADELHLATQCKAREQGLASVLTARFPEPTAASLKRLLLEFRHRVAAGLAEVLPADPVDPVEACMVLAGTLERGRRSFGRVLHAALFLYQKLRTLVPSELQEPLADPLSRLVPVPFYVLPYKAQHAMRRGAARIVQGCRRDARSGTLPMPAPRPGAPGQERQSFQAWLAARVEELEERLPLNASSPVEVPNFLAQLLWVRAQAAAGATGGQGAAVHGGPRIGQEAHLQDCLDVLLADALTVYMSAWRLMRAPQEEMKRTVRVARRSSVPPTGVSAAGCTDPHPFRELRLGQRPPA